MQYLRRDKKDEEDGKEFIFMFFFFCGNETRVTRNSLLLGPQSNPFQNLDKSAVLQEVSLKLYHNYLILSKLRSFNYF